jgi:hypothetical protein
VTASASRPTVAALVVAIVILAACTSGGGPSRSARNYLAIATPANRRLDHAFDALSGSDRDNLEAAKTDLRSIAVVERGFDRQLLTVGLTPDERRTAEELIASNESRAALTTRVAAAASLAQLHALEPQLTAANRPVEDKVRALRRQLGLPPPDTD